ncbi:MAG: hypothetical protein LBE76_04445, partial [Nitrososphaerota archaeon]|nr:hypothetical protein [Nitrososphaerota archaeon]
LVSKDGSSENSFLYYISTGKDCFRLYPNKKYAGVPPELFMFYQTEICKTQKYSLLIAHKIAQRLRKCESDNKKYEAICKEINTDLAVKRKIKKIIVEMIEDGSLNYSEYVALFADDSVNRIDTKSNVWKYISYFAYNADWVSSESLTYTALPSMLQYVARQIFERCIAEKSVAWFKEKVLDKFTIGKISVPWLRRQFLKCASNNECFNYSTWKSLSSGENGRENFVEALYRFRLLWTEWLRTNNISDNLEMPKLQSQTDALDLPLNVKTAVYTIVNDYLCQRGRERFEKDVIAKLITGEKSFLWFKQKLVALNKDYYDEHFWDTFLADDVGYSIVSIRLFQLSLELMNSYRQHVFKPDKL